MNSHRVFTGVLVFLFTFQGLKASNSAPTPPPLFTKDVYTGIQVTPSNIGLPNGSIETIPLGNITLQLKQYLQLSQDESFSARVKTGNGFYNIRMNQRYKKLPVFGAEVILNQRGTFQVISGNYVQGFGGVSIDPTPTITEEQAQTAATNHYNTKEGVTVTLTPGKPRLGFLPFKEGRTLLAWRLELNTPAHLDSSGKTKPPGRWVYYIRAEDGSVLRRFDANASLQQASGPGGNSLHPRTWNQQLDVEPQANNSQRFIASTARLQTFDLNGTIDKLTAVTGPLNPFGNAAVNDAHGNAETVADMLEQWFGYNSINENGLVLRNYVNFGTGFEGTLWVGRGVYYGDGGNRYFPLAGALDVVSHEFHHGFTQFHSNLEMDGESGSISESFSDLAGVAAEHYLDEQNANFMIGEKITKNNSPIRSLCNPRQDGVSINLFRDYQNLVKDYDPQTVIYAGSGIMNLAFCKAATKFKELDDPSAQKISASTIRELAKIFYEANALYWTSTTTFQQASQGTLDAAAGLGYSQDKMNALKLAWMEVGLNPDASTVPLAAPSELTVSMGNQGATNPVCARRNLRFNWKDNSSNETGFRIDASTDGGNSFVPLYTVSGANRWTFDGSCDELTGSDYLFRIVAINGSETSAPSNQVSVLLPVELELNFTRTGDNSAQVVWWCRVSNGTLCDSTYTYHVEKKEDNGSFTPWVQTTDTQAMFTASRHAYKFRVKAEKAGGNFSRYSNEIYLDARFPLCPTALRVSFAPGAATLRWTRQTNIATGYRIERTNNQDDPPVFIHVFDTNANAGACVHANPPIGIRYKYRVSPFNNFGATPDCNTVNVDTTPAHPPTNVQIEKSSSTAVWVFWRTIDNPDKVQFALEERQADGSFVQRRQLGNYFNDGSGLLHETVPVSAGIHTFRVVARAVSGNFPSGPVTIDTINAPNHPSSLTLAVQSGPQVLVSWQDASNNETGFEIEKRFIYDNSPAVILATVPANQTSYTDTEVSHSRLYYYAVRSISGTSRSIAWPQKSVYVH